MLVYPAVGLFLIVMGDTAIAGKPDDITESEMQLLPRYCADTMGFKYGDAYSNTSPRAAHWVALMGKDFWAMHHYCWAQINMGRSMRAGVSAQTRKGLWESARGDYMYVIKQAAQNFVMLPELYTRLGEVELLLAKPDRANLAFAKARILKPDYWPAYSKWADFLIKIGKRAEALKIVSLGLEQSPDAKVLLEQYRILGGKPTDLPKPIPKPQTTTDKDAQQIVADKAESPNGEGDAKQ